MEEKLTRKTLKEGITYTANKRKARMDIIKDGDVILFRHHFCSFFRTTFLLCHAVLVQNKRTAKVLFQKT